MTAAPGAGLDRSLRARFGAFYSIPLGDKRCFEDVLHIGLPMNEEYWTQVGRCRFYPIDPARQLGAVCVRAIPIQNCHLCPQWNIIPVDPNRRWPRLDPSPKRPLRLIAHE